MPLIPALASSHIVEVASPAFSVSLWRDARVGLGKFVAVFAMGGRSSFLHGGCSCKSNVVGVIPPSFARNHFLVGKPGSRSRNDVARVFPGNVREVRSTIPLAINRNPYGVMPVAAIANLLRMGRPSNVARLVIAVVIDPVYRVLRRRTRQHVLLKQSIGLPALADRNSPTAVTVKHRVFPIVAALPHAQPDVIQRRMGVFLSHTAVNSTLWPATEGGLT